MGWTSPAKSSLGFKYTKLRDHPLHSGATWLKGKRETDGAEGLWRVHDKLYDLHDFARSHPGGPDWINFTKGTDITEAFESHHVTATPGEVLKKYYSRDATTARNSPFTFEEGGFYRTLKREVGLILPKIPNESVVKSKLITDGLLLLYIFTAMASSYLGSYSLGLLSGVLLGCTAIAAHNFFHQKDNFRMYYFSFTFMDFREWRISHVLSHHLYTNTIDDLEISSLEPFLQYLPTPKHVFFRYFSWFYSPIVYALLFVGHFIKTILEKVMNHELLLWHHFLPFSVLALMTLATGNPLTSLKMFLFITVAGSIHFSLVGVNAAHHHPDIFHDGDAPRPVGERDWGVFQMDAVMDRRDITGSHFLVLTNFGDHALHHLFPTVDHGKLPYLYPVFLKTCEEFGVRWRVSSQLELAKGQFRQLARTEPKLEPRGKLKLENRTLKLS